MQMHAHGELKTDFNRREMMVGYHAPCHLKTLGVTNEPVELMQLIPGLKVQKYSDKCCGMGGTYGLKSINYDLSMKIGQRLFDEIASSDADQLITGCGACGMQIHQGTMRESIHPMKLLAKAYQKETTTIEAA
jgi:glycerol-3-phosphate dehydrogenase subunit C